MNVLHTLKIGIRLGIGFGILAVFMIVLSVFSMHRMSAIAGTVQYQNKVRIEKLEQLYIAREALAQTGLSASNALAITDDTEAMQELDKLDAQKMVYLAALEKLSPHFAGDMRFQKINDALLKMASGLNRVQPLRDKRQMRELGDFIAYENRPLYKSSRSSFVWKYPLLLDQELTNNESMVRYAAHTYCRSESGLNKSITYQFLITQPI